MVRIKVIKASHIVLAAVLAIVVIVAVIVGVFTLSGSGASPPPERKSTAPPETLPPANLSDGASNSVDNNELAVSVYNDNAKPAASQAARVSRGLRTELEVISPYETDEDKQSEPSDEIMLEFLDYDYENEEVINIEIIRETPQPQQTAESKTDAEDSKSEETPSLTGQASPGNPEKKPEVLIYHTHSREAYEQNADKPQYVETAQWRTDDQRFSVMRVGEELTAALEAAGISVIHDTTDHEPPKHGTSYTRSLVTLESHYKNEPSLKVLIDLHRDGFVDGQKGSNTVNVDGVEAARLMFLIGNGEGSVGSGGFAIKPEWQENYKLANALTEAINAEAPGLCRPVMINTGRYNQHVSTSCLLVEVGNNKNTLDEALAGIPYLAKAIEEVIGSM